jgi:thiamine pyrophosphokinase
MPAEEGVQKARTVVVVATGASPDAVRAETAGAVVIAADGGLAAVLAAGVTPALVVGDLDSADPALVDRAERDGVPVVRHPRDKDATDLELALDAALDPSPGRIVVLGSAAGRLDHLLGAALLLAADRYAAVEVDAVLGDARLHVVRGERRLAGSPGELVSLLPLQRPAEGVVTEGLRYPLRGETLEPGSSRGVSNVFTAGRARISLASGVLLAVRPGQEDGT